MKRQITWMALAALFTGCSSTVVNDEPARPLSRVETSIVEADNTFGLRLLRTLNNGNSEATNINANTNASNTTTYDSAKNCLMICQRMEPIALRMPTSLALFSLLAVLRFMKLMQASMSTKMPMMLNNHT